MSCAVIGIVLRFSRPIGPAVSRGAPAAPASACTRGVQWRRTHQKTRRASHLVSFTARPVYRQQRVCGCAADWGKRRAAITDGALLSLVTLPRLRYSIHRWCIGPQDGPLSARPAGARSFCQRGTASTCTHASRGATHACSPRSSNQTCYMLPKSNGIYARMCMQPDVQKLTHGDESSMRCSSCQ